MLKIDMHTHLLPPSWPSMADRYGVDGFPELRRENGDTKIYLNGKFFRQVWPNAYDAEYRIEEYAKFGIQTQVVCTVPVMFSYRQKPEHTLAFAQYLNDHIAELVQQYPRHYIGLGTLPLQSPQLAIQELERLATIGIKGIQIGSHINTWNLDAPELFEVFAAAESLGQAILVHPWEMMGTDTMPKYWLPWLVGMPAEQSRAICCLIFGGVLERLPNLRVCFAHGGGSFPATVGRIEHGFNMRPDLVATDNDKGPRQYLDRLYFDSVVHDPVALRYLIDLVGTQQIMLGTDYPFPLGEQQPGAGIAALDLPADQQQHLYHASALRWLDMDAGELT